MHVHSGLTFDDKWRSTEEIASEGAAFNKLFTNSTYPKWFQDFLINSLATQPKMGIWVRFAIALQVFDWTSIEYRGTMGLQVTQQCPKCPHPGAL